MTNILNEYNYYLRERERLERQLEILDGDPRLKKEIEFKNELESLMREFQKAPVDILDLLNEKKREHHAGPHNHQDETKKPARKKRAKKIYTNPRTGEVVETRGGNNLIIKRWKATYGRETVESWAKVVR